MKRRAICLTAFAAMLCSLAASNQPATACTGIRIKPKDGSVIVARTLEFAADLHSNIIVIPRATESVGTAPGDNPGLRWKSKYGMVGANAFGLPVDRGRTQRERSWDRHLLLPRLRQVSRGQGRRRRQSHRSLGASGVSARQLCQRRGGGSSRREAFVWATWFRRTWASCRRAITSSTMPAGGVSCWNTWAAN